MATTFKDPVCSMDVAPESAAGTSKYKGQTYYFCSPGCKKSFDKESEKYVGEGEHTPPPTNILPSLMACPGRLDRP